MQIGDEMSNVTGVETPGPKLSFLFIIVLIYRTYLDVMVKPCKLQQFNNSGLHKSADANNNIYLINIYGFNQ